MRLRGSQLALVVLVLVPWTTATNAYVNGTVVPNQATRAALVAGALPATLGLGSLLYGLTVLPALVALFGGGGFPLAGIFNSLFRQKSIRRSSGGDGNGTGNKEDTNAFLSLAQEALQRWDNAPDPCRRMFICQLSKEALQAGFLPDLRPLDDVFSGIFGGFSKTMKGKEGSFLPLPHQDLFIAARDGLRGCKAKYNCDAPLKPPRYPRKKTP
ncbi:unnamed protein product [Ixodes hexagonus]